MVMMFIMDMLMSVLRRLVAVFVIVVAMSNLLMLMFMLMLILILAVHRLFLLFAKLARAHKYSY
jgi:hypothetical protein